MLGGAVLGAGDGLGEEDGGLADIASSLTWADSPYALGFNFEREARILAPKEEGGFSSTVALEVEEGNGEVVAVREALAACA